MAALESFALALFLAFTAGIFLNCRLQAELLIEPFDPSMSSASCRKTGLSSNIARQLASVRVAD